MFILHVLKVVYFDTLLQVFILKVLSGARFFGPGALTGGAEGATAAQTQLSFCPIFTAYDNSGSTPGQLVGGTVRVQLHELLRDAGKTEMCETHA